MRRTRVAAIITALLLTACGGGGGGGGGGTTPPPGGSGPTWTQGVYAAASTFKDRCEVVRTGRDIEGNVFPDRQGSLLFEKFWLRSWTNETYLWNTEVTDRNPASTASKLDYFALLRTTATTPSGRDKDQFHFTQNTADYLAAINSAPTASYGVSYAAISVTVPREFRVQYVEPNSPAAQVVNGRQNLPRGALIMSVDGVDLVNANTQAQIDILNAGLFPKTAGETHNFVIREITGGQDVRGVTLTSVNLAPKTVNRFSVLSTPTGPVGYALVTTFSPFAAEGDIAAMMTSMKNANVTDLVLDLRYNGGGILAFASQLSHMVAGAARTSGKNFESLRFNAAAGNTNPVTGQANTPTPFYTTGLGFSLANGTALPQLNLARVFVLSTAETCSASEAVINGLRGIDVEVIQIGATTCGKPYGFYSEDNCGETYFSIQFQGVNNKGFGDYADGFTPINANSTFGVKIPGCAMLDDFTHELGDTNEALLATALQYRETAGCPAAQLSAPLIASATPGPGAVRSTGLTPLQQFLRTNRDMRMPY